MLVDTHCHLDYFEEVAQILRNAQAKDVAYCIAPSTNAESAQKLLALTNQLESIFVGVGIHPVNTSTESYYSQLPDQEIAQLEIILQQGHAQLVAIGECGLDFKDLDFHADSTKAQRLKAIQIQLFKQHLQWADEYHLPLIIHNRKANEELLNLIKTYPLKADLSSDTATRSKLTGVFHCFTGSKAFAQQILDLGFYLGLGGILTVDQGLQMVAKTIPMDRILLETDAPYLTPRPIKDTKPWPNEPANTYYVAEKLAELRGLSIEEVATITTENAKRLFNLI